MEIIDKGLDPNDYSKSLLEVNMTEEEASQVELLAARCGCTVEEWLTSTLMKAAQSPKDFTEQCAFMSFMDENRKRSEE